MTATTNKALKAEARRKYHSEWRRGGGKGSSTPGSTKGEHCQASPWDRFFAKYGRARRHPGYAAWLDAHRRK